MAKKNHRRGQVNIFLACAACGLLPPRSKNPSYAPAPDTTVTGATPLTSATSSLSETTTATETQKSSLATTVI